MKDKIKSVIEGLFEGVPESQEAKELQEEMISNAEEKYEDLIQRGFTEEQAYTMVMGSIGDVQELLEELGAQAEGEACGDQKAKSEYWEKQCEYWDKQAEYWKWQGEYFGKQAKKFGQQFEQQAEKFGQQFEEQAGKFSQQFEQQAGDLGRQAKDALNSFMNSSFFENVSSSIKQIISDVGTNFQCDKGDYKDMQICNERKFSEDGITSITMELQNSPVDVDVQLTTDPEILIQELYNKDPQENQLLEYTVAGNALKIHYGSSVIGFPRRGIVRVFLPEACAGKLEELKILTASGDVTLEDIGAAKQVIKTMSGDVAGACAIGEISISTASGDVKYEALEGEASIRTVSGDVKVKKAVGSLNVSTASGDVEIEDQQGNGVIRTASGDVCCNLTKAGEKLEVSTASGDAQVQLPEDASVQMTLKTASGDIRTFFDCLNTEEKVTYVKNGKTAVGTIGEEPYLQLKVTTASGDVDVER